MCVYVCVCREREREREITAEEYFGGSRLIYIKCTNLQYIRDTICVLSDLSVMLYSIYYTQIESRV